MTKKPIKKAGQWSKSTSYTGPMTRKVFDKKKGREIYKYIGPRRMPPCSTAQIDQIMDVVHSFKGQNKIEAEEFAKLIGPKNLCIVLHSMRRWYGAGHGWNSGKKILAERGKLFRVMDLDIPYGVYRGFHVDRGSELSELEPGSVVTIPVTRNNGLSSWTAKREAADKFSGSSKKKVGIVVKLVGGKNIKTFLAPPNRTVGWFNDLFKRTMGEAYRFNEHEYVIQSSNIKVEIVAIKGR